MDIEEKRTIKGWAGRLGIEDERLSMAEAQLLASIAACDRLLEIRDALQDVQARLTRLELFVQLVAPGYDEHVRAMLKRQLTGAS